MSSTNYEIEFIPELKLYRIYNSKFPHQTCAYYDNVVDAIDAWR